MPEFKYIGMTVYIKPYVNNLVKLAALLSKSPIQHFDVEGFYDEDIANQAIFKTAWFDHFNKCNNGTRKNSKSYPKNTPLCRKDISVDLIEIDEEEYVRLYIPILHRTGSDVYAYRTAKPLIETLFKDDIVHFVTKEGFESDDYSSLKPYMWKEMKPKTAI